MQLKAHCKARGVLGRLGLEGLGVQRGWFKRIRSWEKSRRRPARRAFTAAEATAKYWHLDCVNNRRSRWGFGGWSMRKVYGPQPQPDYLPPMCVRHGSDMNGIHREIIKLQSVAWPHCPMCEARDNELKGTSFQAENVSNYSVLVTAFILLSGCCVANTCLYGWHRMKVAVNTYYV